MINIVVASMGFSVKATPNGVAEDGRTYLGYYTDRFNDMRYDWHMRRMVPVRRYRHYCRATNKLYLPRYALDEFCGFLVSNGAQYTIHMAPAQKVVSTKIEMIDGYKDKSEKQTAGINAIVNGTTVMRGLSLQTGKGKTVSTIRIASILGVRTFIRVGGIVDQWVEAIKKWTKCCEGDIYLIQGQKSIHPLIQKIDKSIYPKFILASIDTLRKYVLDDPNYAKYPNFDDFIASLGAGLSVIDEAHRTFHTNYIVDIRTNIPIIVPLTATFVKNDRKGEQVFERHYPPELRHGEGDYDKYTNITAYYYSLGRNVVPHARFKTKDGYNHSMFENWLIQKKMINNFWMMALKPMFVGHFINKMLPNEKCLIICTTTAFCTWVLERIRGEHPQFISNLFIGDDPDEILKISDVIVTTYIKGGTAKDIPNLRTVLMTYASRAETVNIQSLGRLRELPNSTPEYAYSMCRDIPTHNDYAVTRKELFSSRGLTFREVRI